MARKKRRMSAKARAAALRNLAKARRARGGGKRRRRRTVRLSNSAPRRRRYSMARKRKSGGRRKGIQVTPLRIGKAALVVSAIGLALKPNGVVDEARYILGHMKEISANPASQKVHAKQLIETLIPPLAIGIVGPKLLEKGVQLISKGEPAIGRVARVKLITV